MDEQQLTAWAQSCRRINYLTNQVMKQINAGDVEQAVKLSERARKRAWRMYSEMLKAGATKPEGYNK